MITLLGVVLLGTLQGIPVALVVSLLSLGQQEFHPSIEVLGHDAVVDSLLPLADQSQGRTWCELLLVRIEGRLFFDNAQVVSERILALIGDHHPKVVALDGRALIDREYSALKMLNEAEQRLARAGLELWLVGLNPRVQQMVPRSDLGARLGASRRHPSRHEAVQSYEHRDNSSWV